MPSSTSSFDFERDVPDLPWRGLLLAVVALTVVATVGWEIRARAWGYRPALNDTPDLWADQREAVKPDSMVIIGDSRSLFDNDLDTFEQAFGKRPIQLGNIASCGYVILENLASDQSFHGTVVASLIPGLWLAPPGSPPYRAYERALKRYQNRTLAQRSGHHLGMWLKERLAFMNDDLKLKEWLAKLPIQERAAFHPHPPGPPDFQTFSRDRQVRMWDSCAKPGPLQDRVKYGWPGLFTPPPPPSYIPKEAFFAAMGKAVEQRFADTAAAVKKIQARGGKVVFVRYPMSGPLKELEDKGTPRAGPWTRILKESGAPGIYFEDYPELASFNCPEWSHLSAPDAVEFTKRLMPHLKSALAH